LYFTTRHYLSFFQTGSKPRRMFFEEWFLLKNGRPHPREDELREEARKLANAAIDHAIVEEFERHPPGRTNSGGEVFKVKVRLNYLLRTLSR